MLSAAIVVAIFLFIVFASRLPLLVEKYKRYDRDDLFDYIVDGVSGVDLREVFVWATALRRLETRSAVRQATAMAVLILGAALLANGSGIRFAATMTIGLTVLELLGRQLWKGRLPQYHARGWIRDFLFAALPDSVLLFGAAWELWFTARQILSGRYWFLPLGIVGLLVIAYLSVSGRSGIARMGLRRATRTLGVTPAATRFLYLRSFADDRLYIRSPEQSGVLSILLGHRRQPFEETMALTVSLQGPTAAIGKPGERLPRPGAFRLYKADDEWKEAVAQMAESAKAVFLVAGTTEGLAWEIAYLGRRGFLGKTLVIIPPTTDGSNAKRIVTTLALMGLSSWAPRVVEFLEDMRPDTWWTRTSTLIGMAVGQSGEPVFYLSDDTDWASYGSLLWRFVAVRDGTITEDEADAAVRLARDPEHMAQVAVRLVERNPLLRQLVDTEELRDFVKGQTGPNVAPLKGRWRR